jgi:hypothetical protein
VKEDLLSHLCADGCSCAVDTVFSCRGCFCPGGVILGL